MEKEKIKNSIRESLENSFINDFSSVEKEMKFLNILISSFSGVEYNYNEYCGSRMNFEIDACDEIDIDFNSESQISSFESAMIQSRAINKSFSNQTDYESVLEEEYVLALLNKFLDIDRKIFYTITLSSSMNLIKERVSSEVWNEKESYFRGICHNKAVKHSDSVAENNKERHEQQIRSSMM